MPRYEDLNQSFIHGQWVEGQSERTYDIVNPYNDSVITTVRLATARQLEEAFESAEQAQREWAATSAEERKDVLRKAAEYLQAHRPEIVNVIVRETGGTIVKANFELNQTLAIRADWRKRSCSRRSRPSSGPNRTKKRPSWRMTPNTD